MLFISACISECDLNVRHLIRFIHSKEDQVPSEDRLDVERDIRDDVSPIPPHQRLVHPAVGAWGVHEDAYGVVLLGERDRRRVQPLPHLDNVPECLEGVRELNPAGWT